MELNEMRFGQHIERKADLEQDFRALQLANQDVYEPCQAYLEEL